MPCWMHIAYCANCRRQVDLDDPEEVAEHQASCGPDAVPVPAG